jgi:hypothetical protein
MAVARALDTTWIGTGKVVSASGLVGNMNEIQNRLAAVEGQLQCPGDGGACAMSAFRAHKTSSQSVPEGVVTDVTFDTVDLDLASEYSATTSAFTVRTAGFYLVGCHPIFETGAAGTSGYGVAYIMINGINGPSRQSGFFGDFWTASRDAVNVVRLSAGDVVQCAVQHSNTGAARIVRSVSSFEATRIAL